MNSAVLIQQATGPYEDLLLLTQDIHRDYCRRHHIDYWCIFGRAMSDHSRPGDAHWEKVRLIEQAFAAGYEIAVHLDVDTLIVADEDLRAAVPEDALGMTWHTGDWSSFLPHVLYDHFNVGAIYARNCLQVEDLLHIWENTNPGAHCWYEQHALHLLAKQWGSVYARSTPFPVVPINSRWNSIYPGYMSENPAVLAWHGHEGTRERKARMKEAIRRYYPSADCGCEAALNAPSRTDGFELPSYLAQKDCRYGRMLFNKNDIWIGRSLEEYGEFSEGEIDLWRQIVKPGDVVIDAGANIGCHTLWFARQVGSEGQVFAFEPQGVMFDLLSANMTLNGIENVKIRQAALGSEFGFLPVPQLDMKAVQSFGSLSLRDANNGLDTEVHSIDNLALDRLDFLKIDVEGMEEAVLEGAEETIRRCRPVLYVENNGTRPGLIRQIEALGYTVHWHCPPLFNPDNFACNLTNVFGRVVSENMLCLPNESPLLNAELDLTTKPIALEVNGEANSVAVADPLNYAALMINAKQYEQAEAALLAALEKERTADLLRCMASSLAARKEWAAALPYLQEAVQADTQNGEGFRQLGGCLSYLGRHEESGDALRQSLELSPRAPLCMWNYALWLLADGQWTKGWAYYRWGFTCGQRKIRTPESEWDGEWTKTLFVWAEQGFGDTIQYLGLLEEARKRSRAAKIILEVQPELLPLLQDFAFADVVYARTDDLCIPHGYAAHCALTSLPNALNVTPDDCPMSAGYLRPDPARVALWRSRLQADGLKVGVCWAGSATHGNDASRSIRDADFEAFAPILNVPGATCCSLMEGDAPDGENALRDFADTAAVIANLDLVISVDTAVAHLAAAMGKPTWILLPFAADFRWLRERTDTPWYSSATLYRQKAFGDWGLVFARVAADLAAFAEGEKG